MLTNVPKAVSHAVRKVTLNHPNSIECVVWRKQVKRVEVDPATGDPSNAMGMPTLGGMGVLKSEDEAEIEYVELGPAKVLMCGIYQPTEFLERDNGLLQENAQEAQIEALAEPGTSWHFVADSEDLVAIDIGLGVILAATVAKTLGNVNIPPYTRKYVLNPRDDLHHLTPFQG